jgi:hypothetical protein
MKKLTEMEAVKRAEWLREEHKRACLVMSTTLVVLGAAIGLFMGYHEHGFVVEVVGLYLVASVG